MEKKKHKVTSSKWKDGELHSESQWFESFEEAKLFAKKNINVDIRIYDEFEQLISYIRQEIFEIFDSYA